MSLSQYCKGGEDFVWYKLGLKAKASFVHGRLRNKHFLQSESLHHIRWLDKIVKLPTLSEGNCWETALIDKEPLPQVEGKFRDHVRLFGLLGDP
jgi:hypothetical protein